MNSKGINILQQRIRDTILFKNKSIEEINILYNTSQNILNNIDKCKNNKIITNNDYFDNVKQLNTILAKIIEIKYEISIKNILKCGIFKYIKLISEYKLLFQNAFNGDKSKYLTRKNIIDFWQISDYIWNKIKKDMIFS